MFRWNYLAKICFIVQLDFQITVNKVRMSGTSYFWQFVQVLDISYAVQHVSVSHILFIRRNILSWRFGHEILSMAIPYRWHK